MNKWITHYLRFLAIAYADYKQSQLRWPLTMIVAAFLFIALDVLGASFVGMFQFLAKHFESSALIIAALLLVLVALLTWIEFLRRAHERITGELVHKAEISERFAEKAAELDCIRNEGGRISQRLTGSQLLTDEIHSWRNSIRLLNGMADGANLDKLNSKDIPQTMEGQRELIQEYREFLGSHIDELRARGKLLSQESNRLLLKA